MALAEETLQAARCREEAAAMRQQLEYMQANAREEDIAVKQLQMELFQQRESNAEVQEKLEALQSACDDRCAMGLAAPYHHCCNHSVTRINSNAALQEMTLALEASRAETHVVAQGSLTTEEKQRAELADALRAAEMNLEQEQAQSSELRRELDELREEMAATLTAHAAAQASLRAELAELATQHAASLQASKDDSDSAVIAAVEER